MKLRDYLNSKETSISELAKQLDYERAHISRVVNGIQKPSPKLARAIEKYTEGKVTVKDLLHSDEDGNS